MEVRFATRLSIAPLIIGFAGAGVGLILVSSASAKGFFCGALLVALATLVSGVFYVRRPVRTAGLVLVRLAMTSVLKWMIVMAGTALVLAYGSKGGLQPAAFTCGVIAGLVSTLFNTVQTSTGASTS